MEKKILTHVYLEVSKQTGSSLSGFAFKMWKQRSHTSMTPDQNCSDVVQSEAEDPSDRVQLHAEAAGRLCSR